MTDIYIYSQRNMMRAYTHEDGDFEFAKGKLGQTNIEVDPDLDFTACDVRIKQQDSTSTAQKLIKLHEDSTENIHNDANLDDAIRAHGEQMGVWRHSREAVFGDGSDREWVDFLHIPEGLMPNAVRAQMVETYNRVKNSYFYGVARPDSYAMRQEQADFVEFARKRFIIAKSKAILCNAKMRFGKTHSTYRVCEMLRQELGKDTLNVLMLTHKPEVEDSWDKDMANHVAFDGWDYQYAKGINTPLSFATNTPISFIVASLQDMNGVDRLNKQKFNNIFSSKIDLLIIDEQHVGTETELATTTMSRLDFDYKIELSGTPLRALLTNKYDMDDIFTWNYIMEQEKRNIEKDLGWKTEVYRWLPVCHMKAFNLSDDAKNNASYYDDEEQFKFEKFFAVENDELVNKEAVKDFFMRHFGKVGRTSLSASLGADKADHQILKMPSVASCKAVAELLRNEVITEYRPGAIMVLAEGDTNIKTVQATCKDPNNKKTVCLTVRAGLTGTTVPEWDSIFMMDDAKSITEYMQAGWRPGSPWKAGRKESFLLADYNPQRMLNVLYDWAAVEANAAKKPVNSVLGELLDCLVVTQQNNNKFVDVVVEDVVSAVAAAPSAVERFASAHNVNFDVLDEEDVIDILSAIQNANKGNGRSVQINDNDIETGKLRAKVDKPKKNKQKDLTKAELRLLQRQAVEVVSRIPNFLFKSQNPNILSTNDITLNGSNDKFVRAVGITISDFETLMEYKLINPARVDLCILRYQASQQKAVSVNDLLQTLLAA